MFSKVLPEHYSNAYEFYQVKIGCIAPDIFQDELHSSFFIIKAATLIISIKMEENSDKPMELTM